MSDFETVKAFNPDVQYPCPYCKQLVRLKNLDDHNDGRCICKECDGTGRVEIDCISCERRVEEARRASA